MFAGWRQDGVSRIGGGLAYIAVRWFGGSNYKPRSFSSASKSDSEAEHGGN